MQHVVINRTEKCRKCEKDFMGSAISIMDFYACTDCYENYTSELEPKIKQMVRDYFQPERLSEKDPQGYTKV